MNIVLIGMPASGKTVVAKMLSNITNREQVDVDKYLEKKESKTIRSIFDNFGEEKFRDLEEQYTKELSERDNIIISTGGGVIKRKSNIDHLKNNGRVIFIDRDVEDIMKENHEERPLLQNIDNVKKLYNERYHLYNEYADIIFKNKTTLDELVEEILNYLKDEKII